MPQTAAASPDFRFDNSYARDLPGFYVAQHPARAPAPRLLRLNRGLAQELGLDADALAQAVDVFAGNALPQGAQPIAQAYAGHQFGGFSPQLGDGRALLLGEVIDRNGARRDIALKGSGRTPFSRGGDGRAAVGPVLREYLIGEAMHALHIPTSRALAAVATGQPIWREIEQQGAVLTRVAASHIRVGTFQFFAARGEVDKLRQLTDYAIARHYPQVAGAKNAALSFLEAVIASQAALIARWMGVGFIHGVMNTDNMAISGETIDYGPCAFMDAYAPGTVFSSIDHNGRYAYANQPLILGWNLARLAETLLALIDENEDRAVALARAALAAIAPLYRVEWLRVMRAKLGLAGEDAGDLALAEDLLTIMAGQGADWTLTFRRLATVAGDPAPLRALFGADAALDGWLARWRARSTADAAARMNAVNPIYIPRNHLVEAALVAAGEGDMVPFDALLAVITDPFTERPGLEGYGLPAPADFGPYRTFCGT
ncbi:MAG: YdiU family protein [Pseudorhodobacter sp.]|nr:YdiU family protein [Pseudorhodobacter sp.]